MRFQNDGGPLIAFDAGFADQWHGNTSDDYSNPIPPGSDYERACNARGPADLLQLADGVGVVIGRGTAFPLLGGFRSSRVACT